ncbi:striatin-4-like [Coturnix japonica]|nr:striatin-4-like [Coturnix japonica]
MVAHLDAVTCLAIDPNGTHMVSGSHDCSVRLWLLPHRKCIQELPAHRRKYDEAVQAAAFHPSRPLFATGGADSMVKVYV